MSRLTHQGLCPVRLDAFLSEQLKLSRAAAQRLIASGRVCLQGRVVRAKGLTLTSGQGVEVTPESGQGLIPQPELPLTILARGEGWAIVDKPAHWPVHPLRPGETGTVLNAMIPRFPGLGGVGEGALRSGVVHRLDVQTTGCLAWGLTPIGWDTLRTALKRRDALKRYRALVRGRLLGHGQQVMRLAVSRHRPAKVCVVAQPTPQSRRCDLTWRSLRTFRDSSLVEVELGTGFLHQVRVMLAAMGHPLLGDPLYGGPAEAAPRVMLHASELRLGPAHAVSPDPADFAAVLESQR